MLFYLFKKFWESRHQFIRYFIIGCSAFLLDLGSLFFLKEYAHMSPVTVIIITQPFLIAYVFFLNKHWSFKSNGVTHAQFIRFVILVSCNYIFSIAWMWTMHQQLLVNYLITRLTNVMLAVTWNFFLYKYWVYKTVERKKVTEEGS